MILTVVNFNFWILKLVLSIKKRFIILIRLYSTRVLIPNLSSSGGRGNNNNKQFAVVFSAILIAFLFFINFFVEKLKLRDRNAIEVQRIFCWKLNVNYQDWAGLHCQITFYQSLSHRIAIKIKIRISAKNNTRNF